MSQILKLSQHKFRVVNVLWNNIIVHLQHPYLFVIVVVKLLLIDGFCAPLAIKSHHRRLFNRVPEIVFFKSLKQ